MTKRLDYLDVAKGIAIIFVMMGHSCGFPFKLTNVLTAYYMPLFFLISGYVYSEKNDVKTNICKRTKRLVVPYFGYSVFLLFVSMLFGDVRSLEKFKTAILGIIYSRSYIYPEWNLSREPIMTVMNGPMWFLTAMLCTSIVFFVLVRKQRSGMQWGVICIMLFALACIFRRLPILLPWSLDTVPVLTIFMLTGYFMKKKNWLQVKVNGVFLSLMAIMEVIYLFLVKIYVSSNISIREYGPYGDISVLLFMVIGVMGSWLCIQICRFLCQLSFMKKGLELVGRHSLSLLALHIWVFGCLGYVLSICSAVMSVIPQSVAYWLISVIRIGVTILVVLGIDYIMDLRKVIHEQ